MEKLHLSGTGEPLMNPDIVKIAQYAMRSGVAEKVELITNAFFLQKNIADGLIDADIDFLKISIQGIDEEAYRNVSSINIDFEQLVENIAYFYLHKKNTKVRIKIMASMIETEEKKAKFYKIFQPICDEIVIENIKEIYAKIDYSRAGTALEKNFYDEEMIGNQICTRPFFSVNIWADGSVGQCANVETLKDIYFGNAVDGFDKIWNGQKYNEFLLSLLKKENFSLYSICSVCKEYQSMALSSDVLDGHEEELIKKYEEKLKKINKN